MPSADEARQSYDMLGIQQLPHARYVHAGQVRGLQAFEMHIRLIAICVKS
jgi:hypothetical protein